ncbi:MAG: hypothetical protein ISS19_05610 [Bacteroidales bacterium]|nr:hypothetical protein [Bacteroidales bacterium]
MRKSKEESAVTSNQSASKILIITSGTHCPHQPGTKNQERRTRNHEPCMPYGMQISGKEFEPSV